MSKKNYFKERIMLLILLFAFMTPFGTLAQTIQLTGLVTDAANEPIIGASVVEKVQPTESSQTLTVTLH